MSLPSLFDLGGQRVLVTGAASGIGLAISEAMLEARRRGHPVRPGR
jgi:NAD(P)-dependent dehydrogenase (short-subunit alcohol dehydrogenase family)